MDKLAALLLTFSMSRRRAGPSYSKVLAPILVALAAFLIDINTPNGVVDGFLYVSAVLVCAWIPTTNAALYTALGLMIPMILGFALSPDGVPVEVALVNRCVAMGTIWLAAGAVWCHAQAAWKRESILTALQQKLLAAEGAAYEDRIALSGWLREEIRLELTMVDWRLNQLARRGRFGPELKSEALLLRRAIQRANHSVYGKMIRLNHEH